MARRPNWVQDREDLLIGYWVQSQLERELGKDMLVDLVVWRQRTVRELLHQGRLFRLWLAFAEACQECGR